jgi:hypothetical protein
MRFTASLGVLLALLGGAVALDVEEIGAVTLLGPHGMALSDVQPIEDDAHGAVGEAGAATAPKKQDAATKFELNAAKQAAALVKSAEDQKKAEAKRKADAGGKKELDTKAKEAHVAKKEALKKKLLAAIDSGDTSGLTKDEIAQLGKLREERANAAIAAKAAAQSKMTPEQKSALHNRREAEQRMKKADKNLKVAKAYYTSRKIEFQHAAARASSKATTKQVDKANEAQISKKRIAAQVAASTALAVKHEAAKRVQEAIKAKTKVTQRVEDHDAELKKAEGKLKGVIAKERKARVDEIQAKNKDAIAKVNLAKANGEVSEANKNDEILSANNKAKASAVKLASAERVVADVDTNLVEVHKKLNAAKAKRLQAEQGLPPAETNYDKAVAESKAAKTVRDHTNKVKDETNAELKMALVPLQAVVTQTRATLVEKSQKMEDAAAEVVKAKQALDHQESRVAVVKLSVEVAKGKANAATTREGIVKARDEIKSVESDLKKMEAQVTPLKAAVTAAEAQHKEAKGYQEAAKFRHEKASQKLAAKGGKRLAKAMNDFKAASLKLMDANEVVTTTKDALAAVKAKVEAASKAEKAAAAAILKLNAERRAADRKRKAAAEEKAVADASTQDTLSAFKNHAGGTYGRTIKNFQVQAEADIQAGTKAKAEATTRLTNAKPGTADAAAAQATIGESDLLVQGATALKQVCMGATQALEKGKDFANELVALEKSNAAAQTLHAKAKSHLSATKLALEAATGASAGTTKQAVADAKAATEAAAAAEKTAGAKAAATKGQLESAKVRAAINSRKMRGEQSAATHDAQQAASHFEKASARLVEAQGDVSNAQSVVEQANAKAKVLAKELADAKAKVASEEAKLQKASVEYVTRQKESQVEAKLKAEAEKKTEAAATKKREVAAIEKKNALQLAGAKASLDGAQAAYDNAVIEWESAKREEAYKMGKAYATANAQLAALNNAQEENQKAAQKAKAAMLSAVKLVGLAKRAAINAASLAAAAKEPNAKAETIAAAAAAQMESTSLNEKASTRLRTAQWMVMKAKSEAARQAEMEAKEGASTAEVKATAEADAEARELEAAREKARVAKEDMVSAQSDASDVVKRITMLAMRVRRLKGVANMAGATQGQTAAYMTADGELKGLQASSSQLIQAAKEAEARSKAATKALEAVEAKQSGAVYHSMKSDALEVKAEAKIAAVAAQDQHEWTKLNNRIASLEKKNGLPVQAAGPKPSSMSKSGGEVSVSLFAKLKGKVDSLVKQHAELKGTADAAKQNAEHAIDVLKSKFGEKHMATVALRASIKTSVEVGSKAAMQKMIVAEAQNAIGVAEAKQKLMMTKAKQDGAAKLAEVQERLTTAKNRAVDEYTQATSAMQAEKEKNDRKVEDELSLKIKDIKKKGLGVFDESQAEEAARKDAKAQMETFAKEVQERLNAVKAAGDAATAKLEAEVKVTMTNGKDKELMIKAKGEQLVKDAQAELASAQATLQALVASVAEAEARVQAHKVPAAAAPASKQ